MRTIAHISDLHFGLEEPAIAQALVRELQELRPSLVVVSGDLTQRARVGQYRSAAAFLAQLPGPHLVVPGNHDIPLFNVVRRFASPLGRYQRLITPDLGPVYQDDELLVMGINTARPFSFTWDGFWRDGRISGRQLQDVQRCAESRPGKLFRIVVTHHPFIPPPGHRGAGVVLGAAEALVVMEQCHIDMLLAGHLHVGYSGDVRAHHEQVTRSILSVQAGTAISTRRRSQANAYNLITIEPNHVHISVRAWDGEGFGQVTVSSFANQNGWTPI
jgi:3',5'-cyclic AMP phosphodiesterase CpdA